MRSTTRVWLALALLAGVMILGACGGGDDGSVAGGSEATSAAGTRAQSTSTKPPSSAGGAPVTANDGSCDATISGGVSGSIRSRGGASAVNTDYWFNESELLQASKLIGETEAQVQAKIAAKEFVFYPLILNCGDAETGINFLPQAKTHEQFPLGPKTYPIAAGVPGAGTKDGEVSVLIMVDGDPYRSKGGTFEVTRFDKSGIAGRFAIEIEEGVSTGSPKTGRVTGTFDMGCTGSNTRSGCSR